jgi:hypothetical protein
MPRGGMEAKEWSEMTPGLSGDLGGEKISGAKTPLISEEISGILRFDAWVVRSKLHLEAVIAAK